MSFQNTPLFGGAITVDFPSSFRDVSGIRQVPDNQEVYLDENGFSSIVVDILERVDKADDEALQFHLEDVVQGTGDETTVVRHGPVTLQKMSTTPATLIHFIQTPAPAPIPTGGAVQPPTHPSHRRTADFTSIHLLLLRLEAQTTDIVITVNVPHYPGEYEQEAANDADGKSKLMRDADVAVQKIASSFEINDFGLFGDA